MAEIRNAKFGTEPEGNRLLGDIVLNGWLKSKSILKLIRSMGVWTGLK
jgi:hypothetical protein